MSLFAGIYCLDSHQDIATEIQARLREALNRSLRNSVTEFSWPGTYVVGVDVGAYGHPCFVRTDDGGVLVVGGQLLAGATGRDRHLADMAATGDSLAADDLAALRQARGTFCLGAYTPDRHRLLLAVDRLGVRPLYYYDDGRRAIFSTTLRVFETLARELGLSADQQALVEINTLDFPLGTRTPFKNVRRLRGGEAVSWCRGSRCEQVYWKWDRVANHPGASSDAARELHAVFMDAVRIRNGSDRRARAFLSGGLDSRCVVAALAASGVAIETYNMSPVDSYDEIIGADYASRIGASHHAISMTYGASGGSWPRLIAEVVNGQPPPLPGNEPDRPRVFWSGDGGSVGLGRVYMSEPIVASLRRNDVATAVREFLTYNGISPFRSVLRQGVRTRVEESFLGAIGEEIGRFRCEDPGKALFLFLLENDQRRHMTSFYEELDVNRIEYETPFFDGEFLAAATALDLDATLQHGFYVRDWLPTFGRAITEVPWQAYPGHEPCPLPLPAGGISQWQGGRPTGSWSLRVDQAGQALTWACSRSLPVELFSRVRLVAVGASALLTGRNYSHVFREIETSAHYLELCGTNRSGSQLARGGRGNRSSRY